MDGIGFNFAIIGKPGCGKTTLLRDMLLYHFNKIYEYVFIISPSISEFPYICFYKNDKLNLKEIIGIFEKIEKGKCLIVLDDCISEIKGLEKSLELKKLFFNRRHLIKEGRIDIIFTTQRYMVIPTCARQTLSHFIFFNISKKDQDIIYNEHIEMKKNKFYDLVELKDKYLLYDTVSGSVFTYLDSEYLSKITK